MVNYYSLNVEIWDRGTMGLIPGDHYSTRPVDSVSLHCQTPALFYVYQSGKQFVPFLGWSLSVEAQTNDLPHERRLVRR